VSKQLYPLNRREQMQWDRSVAEFNEGMLCGKLPLMHKGFMQKPIKPLVPIGRKINLNNSTARFSTTSLYNN
jgi:hypothetical protein